MQDKFLSRLNFMGDFDAVLNHVARDFQLGQVSQYNHIPVGYEDLNIRLDTDQNTYFVKIFSKDRKQSDIDRYAGNIEAAIKVGAPHPSLLKHSDNKYLYRVKDTNIQLIVMDWIDGNSFWELSEKPTDDERTEIIEIAAKINSSLHKPIPTYDSWSVNNIQNELDNFGHMIADDDRIIVEKIANEFKAIDIENLPHCFVHGDLIGTNVMRSKRGLHVVDFSVAGYHPRIQELSVLFSDLLFEPSNPENSEKIYNKSIKDYCSYIKLTEQELSTIGVYTRAAQAMHIIGASKAIARGEDDEESQHWLSIGRAGVEMKYY